MKRKDTFSLTFLFSFILFSNINFVFFLYSIRVSRIIYRILLTLMSMILPLLIFMDIFFIFLDDAEYIIISILPWFIIFTFFFFFFFFFFFYYFFFFFFFYFFFFFFFFFLLSSNNNIFLLKEIFNKKKHH